MRFVPRAMLKKLYNRTSLRNAGTRVRFSVKNRLSPASLTGIERIAIDNVEIPLDHVGVVLESGETISAAEISPAQPIEFPLGALVVFLLERAPLDEGEHDVAVSFGTKPFGRLSLDITDAIRPPKSAEVSIPRDSEDDYGAEVVEKRRQFVREQTGTSPKHIFSPSFDPHETRGNIEHFTGAAQIPMGIAGPLLVHGEHAQGEFFIPLATTEGTLVASYNRGMKVIQLSGGVHCSVVDDCMQRAPVFVFESARDARKFVNWLDEHTADIAAVCSESDRFVSLKYIDHYLASKFAYLRFNFSTGDAAGMNMVGKATFAACNWILEHCKVSQIQRFFLESNFATDKKPSMVNTMRTRGKRVTAELVIKREVLLDVMDADTESLYYHSKVANVGSMMSGAMNNGCHAANGITAMFIATGQDVANVAESSTGILYAELTPEKDLYMSITLPSLIVATCGGGTGLPTQRESLALMDCVGVGKVKKFAEIVAGTVMAGEISLGAAISSLDWVSSHEQMGRNDPTVKN